MKAYGTNKKELSTSDSNIGILILDMSYTLSTIKEKGMEGVLNVRGLDGFFKNVVSVHPLEGLLERGENRFGPPKTTQISKNHIYIAGRLGRKMQNAGRPMSIAYFLASQIQLARLVLKTCKGKNIRVVRIGDPYYLGVLGFVFARMLRAKLAIRVPANYEEFRIQSGKPINQRIRYMWIERLLERLVFPNCDLIAGANKDNLDYALSKGGNPQIKTIFRYGNLIQKTHWVKPGLRQDADIEPYIGCIDLKKDRFAITIARLEPLKRIEDAIYCIKRLKDKEADLKLLIIGDGSVRGDLYVYAKKNKVDNLVAFAGERPQEWIAAVIPHASFSISPHMGRALVETMLGEVPSVAYDFDWQREVVKHGNTGILVENMDRDALADGCELLLADNRLRNQLGKNSRELIINTMSPTELTRHEVNIYTRLLSFRTK